MINTVIGMKNLAVAEELTALIFHEVSENNLIYPNSMFSSGICNSLWWDCVGTVEYFNYHIADSGCMTLGKLLKLLPHLWSGIKNCSYLIGLQWGFNKLLYDRV